MKVKLLTILILLGYFTLRAQDARLIIHADEGKTKINKNIYGHFSEHLGRCIYGGIWVGPDSDIPNVDGYRTDVIEALKEIKIPNLRWPGGCFADEYHWKDGIGPRTERPKMINTHWGGVTEDNSFGTHEFLNYCELLGTEPYICGNLGSGTVEEMSKWVEYINFDGVSPMADRRKENGREKSWGVKYWGVGNENWGCGGMMTPEYYADLYRRFAVYCRNYGDHRLFKIAGGAPGDNYHWTEVLMEKIPLNLMNGISLHHYTVPNSWAHKGSATQFTDEEYFTTMKKCLYMDELVKKHSTVMDKYDPEKKVALVVDEWGVWYDVEPGTNPGFLYQQNTLRDAFVAGMTLNIFNNHADRVRMANIAQMVNVLQAIILTKDDKMILTPTYHVFDMYKVHQDATLLPSVLVKNVDLRSDDQEIPALNVSSSKSADGFINISIVNIHPDKDIQLECDLQGADVKSVSGQIITAPKLNVHNTFDQPENITLKNFDGAKVKNNIIMVTIPAKSVVMLRTK